MKIYIDGEKLMESFYDTPESEKSWSRAWRLINHAKLADVRENVRGEWINLDSDTERYDEVMCSNCKQSFTVDAHRWCDIGFTVDDLRFCPNCGADMRGGKT